MEIHGLVSDTREVVAGGCTNPLMTRLDGDHEVCMPDIGGLTYGSGCASGYATFIQLHYFFILFKWFYCSFYFLGWSLQPELVKDGCVSVNCMSGS